GTFSITGVQPGTYTVVAQRIGYTQRSQTGVIVTAGNATNITMSLPAVTFSMQSMISTGVADPTAGVLAPVTVAHVDRSQMPVAVAGGAVQNLEGQVAGLRVDRSTGQPGADVSIVLRTPTSVTQTDAPMMVVDGVVLGNTSTVDIESSDIESVEVIKGAAASS